jgi:hypothetical protein
MQNFGWKAIREETTQKTRHKWEDIIKKDLWEISFGGVDWINLA